MVSASSKGFTLIELTIVLAITGGLIVIALNGQAAAKGQAQFKDSVERVASALDSVRNQALTSRNDGISSSGTDRNNIVFGKQVVIASNSSKIVVTDIIGTPSAKADQFSNTGAQNLTTGGTYTYTVDIPWGVVYSGMSDKEFVFHRLLDGGKLHLYDLSPSFALSLYSFDENPLSDPTISIDLKDQYGRWATVTLDGAHNGTVSRVYH